MPSIYASGNNGEEELKKHIFIETKKSQNCSIVRLFYNSFINDSVCIN